MLHLIRVQFRMVLHHIVVGGEQEAAGACGGIADRVVRTGLHGGDHGIDHWARSEILTGTAGGFLGGAR